MSWADLIVVKDEIVPGVIPIPALPAEVIDPANTLVCYCCLEDIAPGSRRAHACERCWNAYAFDWPGSRPSMQPISDAYITDGRAFFHAKGIELRMKVISGELSVESKVGLHIDVCPCCGAVCRNRERFSCMTCWQNEAAWTKCDKNTDVPHPWRMRQWFAERGRLRGLQGTGDRARLRAQFAEMAKADPALKLPPAPAKLLTSTKSEGDMTFDQSTGMVTIWINGTEVPFALSSVTLRLDP